MTKPSRRWGASPERPFKGPRPNGGLPFSLTDAISRAIYDALVMRLPNGAGTGLPYVVLHERDPRGIVSTFEFEGGERFQVVVRSGDADAYPEGVESAEQLLEHMGVV